MGRLTEKCSHNFLKKYSIDQYFKKPFKIFVTGKSKKIIWIEKNVEGLRLKRLINGLFLFLPFRD